MLAQAGAHLSKPKTSGSTHRLTASQQDFKLPLPTKETNPGKQQGPSPKMGKINGPYYKVTTH